MKDKLFFLLGLPLVWFVVALAAYQPGADKLYLLAVAPAAWLFYWEHQPRVTIRMIQVTGLPIMFLVGLFLFLLKMKPRVMLVASAVMTAVLWMTLVVTFSQSIAIQRPGAIFVWILCCFNFSLCLLPFVAVFIKLAQLVKRKYGKHNP